MIKALRSFFDGFVKGYKDFSNILVGGVNLVLLSVVYYLGIGVGLVMAKAMGKHFFDWKVEKSLSTYWVERNDKEPELRDYYNQY
jgi:hypothetical protein